jgi:hypothetical protein
MATPRVPREIELLPLKGTLETIKGSVHQGDFALTSSVNMIARRPKDTWASQVDVRPIGAGSPGLSVSLDLQRSSGGVGGNHDGRLAFRMSHDVAPKVDNRLPLARLETVKPQAVDLPIELYANPAGSVLLGRSGDDAT